MIKKINDYTHLHLHSTHSLLDGLGTAEQYAERASELGFEYLGISNHGAADGLIKFQKACEKFNISPVLGSELYLVPDPEIKKPKEFRSHMTVWIENEKGFISLMKLLTLANLNFFYHRPRVGYDMILENCEGLIFGTACSASFLHLPGGVDFFKKLHNKVGDSIYLELMPHDYPEQVDTNNLCLDLAEEHKVKTICSQDCHYINAEDWESHDVLLACQIQKKVNDPERWRFNGKDFYLCEPEHMKKMFNEQGVLTDAEVEDSMKNTVEIAERCSGFKIKQKEIKLPMPPQYIGMDEEEVFKSLIVAGFKKRFGIGIEL